MSQDMNRSFVSRSPRIGEDGTPILENEPNDLLHPDNKIGHTDFKCYTTRWMWLRKLNSRHSSRQKSIAHASRKIEKLGRMMGLKKGLRRDMMYRYRKLLRRGKTMARDSRLLIGALAYICALERGFPRTFDEVLEVIEQLSNRSGTVGELTKQQLYRTVNWAREELGFENMPVVKPEHLMGRFSSKLGLSNEEVRKSFAILRGLPSRGKRGAARIVAAACLYLASGAEYQEIERKLGPSMGAVCRRVKRLRKLLEKDDKLAAFAEKSGGGD